jgi:hypothetical protein
MVMADAYYDYNDGASGNDGLTAATAKSTRTEAQGVAGAGDRVICVDGTHAMGASEGGDIFFDFDDNYIESSDTYRGATLQPEAAETTRCARSSGTITPHIIENLTFDGQANGGLTQCFDLVADGTNARTLRMRGTHLIGGDTYGFLCSKIGASGGPDRIEFVSVKLSGSPSTGLFATSGNLSSAGDQTFDLQGTELDGSASSGSITGIQITKIDNLTNTLTVGVKGTYGKLTATGTASAVGMNIKAVDPVITGSDIEIDALASSGTGNFGILVQGQATAVCTGAAIGGNRVVFKDGAGYAIAIGQATVAANVTTSEASGNTVIGVYHTTKTPHGFLLGQAVNGATIRGNTAQDIYVGYLASICTAGTIEGNLAFDCFGPSYYVKGTTAITVQDNIAVISGKHDLPTDERGVLSVAPQGVTNTAGATITRNLVIVADVSKINSLGYIEDASQVCTFSNNTYIIPDTVDISTANLFTYENGAGGAANNTLAQWNAQTEVTNDVIIQMPVTDIAKLIQNYRPISGGVAGSVVIGI